jgi:hypothetical protein
MEKNYIPKIFSDRRYVEMAIEADECPLCDKIMIKKTSEHGVFPIFITMNQEHQAERAGIVFKSSTQVDDYYICQECEKSGKADFLCALCNERKSSDKVQERVGDPAEFLCKDCYEIVSAKTWEKKLDELHEEHKWDYS